MHQTKLSDTKYKWTTNFCIYKCILHLIITVFFNILIWLKFPLDSSVYSPCWFCLCELMINTLLFIEFSARSFRCYRVNEIFIINFIIGCIYVSTFPIFPLCPLFCLAECAESLSALRARRRSLPLIIIYYEFLYYFSVSPASIHWALLCRLLHFLLSALSSPPPCLPLCAPTRKFK